MFFQKVKGFEFGTSAPQSRGTSGGRRSRGCVRLKEELLVPQQSLLSQDKATVSFKAAALLEGLASLQWDPWSLSQPVSL